MKSIVPILAVSLFASAHAAEAPKAFAGLFEKDKAVRGQIGAVVPPAAIEKYATKLEEARRKDPQWFREFTSQAKPGAPLPYHEKLGITKEEYDEYLKLWNQREFKVLEEVMLLLRENNGGWTITATGGASSISTLRFIPEEDAFRSPNGVMKRIDDIKSDPDSILGAWTGSEWRFEAETGLGKTKENIALGSFVDKKYGLLIYRVQEATSTGTRLLDKSLVIRFALGKAGQLTPKTPAKETAAPATPTKPTTPTKPKAKR